MCHPPSPPGHPSPTDSKKPCSCSVRCTRAAAAAAGRLGCAARWAAMATLLRLQWVVLIILRLLTSLERGGLPYASFDIMSQRSTGAGTGHSDVQNAVMYCIAERIASPCFITNTRTLLEATTQMFVACHALLPFFLSSHITHSGQMRCAHPHRWPRHRVARLQRPRVVQLRRQSE